MIIKTKTKNYGDNLVTPPSIFKMCEYLWNVRCNFDLCATKKDSKCINFYSPENNFFSVSFLHPHFNYWFNFPHSEQKFFIKHLFYLWQVSNVKIIGILPINALCSNYALEYILPYAHWKPITGRIKFLDPITLKPSKYNSVNGYVTICYDKRKVIPIDGFKI